ncbi:MAG: hypothetical protein WCK89_16695 [bacterium]
MNTDPIVSEVRQARDKLARRHKNNPDKIYQAMKRAEEKENWPKAKLSVVKPQCACVAETPSTYRVRNASR